MPPAAGKKIGQAFVKLGVDRSPLVRGFKLARRDIRRFGQSLRGIGTNLLGNARQLTATLAGIAAPLALAVKRGAEFGDVISEVGAVSQATAEQLKQLEEQAKFLGRTTSFTAVDVGSGQAELGRAGFDADEIQNAIPSVLALARATKTELADAAGIAAAAIRQFGLDTRDSARVADALTIAANSSFNTLESLGESLKFVGPVARDFNLSMEETVALIGALGNVGIQGTISGTALRRLLTLTGAEAEKLQGIFGVTFADIGGNARNLATVLAEVNKATENLGTADRAAKFKEAFGLLGITAASALGNNIGDVNKLLDKLNKNLADGGGAAQETASAMDDNLGGAFRRLASAAEGVALAVSDALKESVSGILENITGLLGKLTEWISKNQDLLRSILGGIVVVSAFAAGMVAAGVAIASAGIVLTSVVAIVKAISAAVGLLFTPLGAITAIIAALGINFLATGDNASKAFETIKSSVTPILGTVTETLGGIINALKNGDVERATKILSKGVELVFLQLKMRVVNAFKSIPELLVRILQAAVTNTINALRNAYRAVEASVGEFLIGAVESPSANAPDFTSLTEQQIAKVKTELDALISGPTTDDRESELVAKIESLNEELGTIGEKNLKVQGQVLREIAAATKELRAIRKQPDPATADALRQLEEFAVPEERGLFASARADQYFAEESKAIADASREETLEELGDLNLPSISGAFDANQLRGQLPKDFGKRIEKAVQDADKNNQQLLAKGNDLRAETNELLQEMLDRPGPVFGGAF